MVFGLKRARQGRRNVGTQARIKFGRAGQAITRAFSLRRPAKRC